MNLSIREFEQSIVNYINSTVLPIEVKRLVVKDVLNQLEQETNKVLKAELEERESEETEDGN